MNSKFSLLLSSLLSLLSLAKSEPILIIALPQSDHTEVSVSWERGEEILPGALAAIDEAKYYSSNFTVIEVTSGPLTSYGLSYSGNVFEVIANLAWQNRISDIIPGIAGVFHPTILGVLNRFQQPIVSLVHFNKNPTKFHTLHNSICIDTHRLNHSILERSTPKKNWNYYRTQKNHI